MEKLYINIEDYQGTYFAIGRTLTAEGWKEQAMEWSDSDCAEERYDYYKNYDISTKEKELELINDISELWEIEIVPYDENNEEHKELRKEDDCYE